MPSQTIALTVVSRIIRMEEQCMYFKFIVAHPEGWKWPSHSYTAWVLLGAYIASDEPFASLTWPEQCTCLSLIDVPNRLAADA